MKTIYKFKKGSFLSGDAQEVGETLEEIRIENGRIQNEVVVEKAKPEVSPLHPYFTWDDAEAAHQYRLNQAGHLTRNIIAIDYISDSSPSEPYRAFTHLGRTVKEEPGYFSTKQTMGDNELRLHVLGKIRDTMISFYRKLNEYRQYEEVMPVLEAIEYFQNQYSDQVIRKEAV